MMRQRKIPIRTCVGCRTAGDKRSLIRIVRMPSGEIILDATGKISGRGAYLCATPECLHNALKRKRITGALGAKIPEEVVQQLERAVAQGSAET